MDGFAQTGQPIGGEGSELNFEPTELEGAEGAELEGGESDQPFTIDGKEYKTSDLRGYIKGGMLEKDYRQKTSEIAEERRQIAEHRQAAEAWNTLQQYPDLMQTLGREIARVLQGEPAAQPGFEGQPTATPEGFSGAEVEPWRTDIDTMRGQVAQILTAYDKRFQEYNQYAWDQYFAGREAYAQGQVTSLQDKYPYLFPDEVIQAFRDNPEANLEELAKLSNDHWQAFVSQRERTNLEKRKANANARVETGGRTGAPAVSTKEPKDWDDARASALERMKAAMGGSPISIRKGV